MSRRGARWEAGDRPAAVEDVIPDVRDGLTRLQRIVMMEIWKARRELGRESVPTALLYGRVVEHANISEAEFQGVLLSLGAAGEPPGQGRHAGGRPPWEPST